MVIAIIIIAIVLVLALYVMNVYNALVKVRNNAEEAESAIDVHLKQRYDLIPNLVETVKGYAKHESGTLEAVIKARNAAMSATTTEAKDEANNVLQGTLKSLFALSESYPELKANTNFLDLQQQLKKIEDGLLNARKYFNAIVKDMNNKVEMFPSSIVASMFNFKKLSYVKVEEEAKQRVDVKF